MTRRDLNHIEALTLQPDGRLEFRLDTRQITLRPFTTVNWNYQFTLPDGSMLQSETFSVRYTDNRFNWQTLDGGILKVNWYQGDANFGQAVLNAVAGGAGVCRSAHVWRGTWRSPSKFLSTQTRMILRGTLALGGDEWVAGHADPALGVVMVVIEPGATAGHHGWNSVSLMSSCMW